MAHLASISIYPVKSLDPQALTETRLLAGGALQGDRQFALFDAEGKYVNGKRHARVHTLRSHFDSAARILRLRNQDGGDDQAWHVDQEREALQAWLSDYFGFPVTLKENCDAGFPDDTDSPGPTVISTATLQTVASWFPGLTAQQMRLRLRSNLEIGGVEPFWEDRLYVARPARRPFQIGSAVLEGNNPCARCRVPPRDPFTGEGYDQFSQIFRQKREETLPPWAERSRFDHFYRLAINTVVPASEAGKILRVGDPIRVIEP